MLLTKFVVDGFITGEAKNILFSVPCGKRLDHVTSATLSSETVQIRQNGNYLIGTATTPVELNGTTTITVLKDIWSIQLSYMAPSSISGATNNDTLAIMFHSGVITFS